MVDAVSIALSGLRAQSTRIAASANNVANALTAGSIPTAAAPDSNVYRPLSVSFTALTANSQPAGVQAHVTQSESYTVAYSPDSVYADAEGFIAVPDVDLVQESVTILQAKHAYLANLATIKTEKELLGELLEVLS